ncbi:hypothetical protein DOTSEDRAFT_68402 [Dothistroma septosporum NZE10]|uniref:Rrn9 domain-containing protein n=1 Tax=Dothistroma septosporum (strain NZE10 / CBS 128990) TaxID=675120 RepID=N1Q311_DOTSN|nr:hypothetical protein DOTSEDRAFT_68402 [Dothistroma septosporum NZE10]
MSSFILESDIVDWHQNDAFESEDELERDQSHGGEDLSYDDRPGRFYGPDSSWRFYTQAERALAASLDQAENNDLSIHLYNAHAWKQHHRDEQRTIDSKPWHSKQRWIRLDEKGKLPFLPPPTWTAWPLRPEEVPRSKEQWGVPITSRDDDADTIRAEGLWKPSLHLQEEVQAIFLRLAKDRYSQRKWADEESPNEDVKAEEPSKPRRSSFVKPEDDSDELLGDLARLEEPLQQALTPVPTTNADDYIPTVHADDDVAGRILLPLVRHILRKLDHLLLALHRSRQGRRKERKTSGSRTTGSRSDSKSRATPQITATAAKKRKRVASEADKQVDHDDNAELQDISDGVAGQGDCSHRKSSKYNLGTRDWSEVLGVATLVGFDQAVIDRATRRCATLFREGMTMRTMPEVAASVAHDQTTKYIPDTVPPTESEDGGTGNDRSEDMSNNGDQIYPCPHTTCARHIRPFEHQWRLNEHLKRTHKYSDPQLASATVKPSWSSRDPSLDALTHDDDSPISMEIDSDGSERMVDRTPDGRDDFLQPITVHIGRSSDHRAKKLRSRSASRARARSTSSTRTKSDSA